MKKFFLIVSTIVLCSLTALLAWLVVLSEGMSAAGETVQWAQFLGRFHPVILHSPIGLFLGLFAVELFAIRQRCNGLERAAHILVWLLAFTSVTSAGLGLLLASNGDYSGDTFWWHKWLGVVFAVLALWVAFFKVLSILSIGKGTTLYRMLILGLVVLLPIVGHLGGHLTHGSGYLTQYAPEWLSDLLEASETAMEDEAEVALQSSSEANRYTQEIQPLLDQYCVKCHGEEKQKSQYRLDSYEHLMTPGTMGDTPIEPYSISESFLLEYVLLPETDEMAMPPEGKPRPSAEEILALTHWVADGAEGPPVDQAALAAEKAALEAEHAMFEALFSAGIVLLPVEQGSDLLYLDFQNVGTQLSDELVEQLSSYKDRIYEMKRMGSEDVTKLLSALSGAAELRVMNLSGAQGIDSSVDALNGFTGLETLNLFGSDLSGSGLSELSLPGLNKLYLGGTGVSGEDLTQFVQSNPRIHIIGDVDLSEVEAIKAADLENTAEFNPEAKKK